MEPVDRAKVVETPTAWTWQGSDGIWRQRVHPGTRLTYVEAVRNFDALVGATGGTKVGLITDLRKMAGAEHEVRQFYASARAGEAVLAVASITGTPVSRVVMNLFVKLNRPVYPFRLVGSEQEAVEFVREHL